jgi:hypothetical protein
MADPNDPTGPVHPMGVAMQWVARIFAAAMMMILPGLAGLWLDDKFGVGFIGLIGFGFGLVGGMIYLISATRATEVRRGKAARPKAGQDPPQAP